MWSVVVSGDYATKILRFTDRARALEWAQRYKDAFQSHKVLMVEGEAVELKATKEE